MNKRIAILTTVMYMVVVMVLMAVAPNNIVAIAETVEPVNEINNYDEYTGNSDSTYVYAGGLIGSMRRNYVMYCYASGNVEARCKYAYTIAGGFAGQIQYCESGNLVNNVLSMGNVLAHGNYSGMEASYSRFGYLCGKENNNSFWKIYYNKEAQFKPGKTGTEQTWSASWYIGKTASQIKTSSFFVNELGLSSTYWNITSGSLPTLKI